jgi:PelA/Pel-15E family pectate lyase
MDHGGWDKGVEDQAKTAWNGKDKKNKFSGWASKKGEPLGTIDNEATYTQMRHIAAVYREVPEAKYQEAVLKGLDFIFLLQYESGGFAQVYPRRGNYSDNVTFNDNAMVNVLLMLTDMKNHAFPFDSDIIPEEYMVKIEASIEKAVDYILKSQIVSKGKLTAWCAQHDPVTYAPVGARAYELASISGKESVAIVKFLLMQEQTPEVENAVKSAIQWFYDAEDKGVRYVENDPNGVYFVEDAKSSLWYRFYDIQTGSPIFCDRDGIKRYSIAEISEERRNGYSWCDTYPKKLLQFYEKNGLVFTHFEVKMSGN